MLLLLRRFLCYFPLSFAVTSPCHFLFLPCHFRLLTPATFCVTSPLLRTNILMFSVSTVKKFRAGRQTNRGSNSGWRKAVSCLPSRPDRLRGWSILQFSGCERPYLRHWSGRYVKLTTHSLTHFLLVHRLKIWEENFQSSMWLYRVVLN